jgi:hypothetical protein
MSAFLGEASEGTMMMKSSEPKPAVPVHRAIGPHSHAVLDYAFVIFLFIGPQMIGFVGRQARFCWILGAVHLLLTLTSRQPLALFRIVGMPLHAVLELAAGVLLLVLPWIADFSRGVLSRNFFTGIALLYLIVWFFTDYRGLRSRADQ